MISLNKYIQEKLVVNKNYNIKYYPKSWDELRHIIVDRFKELGPGTEQTPIDFNDVDVSEMTTFYNLSTRQGVFDSTKFKYIDISNWDVSKVENMSYMFCQCDNLKSVGDISNWNILNVEKTYAMFLLCKNLISIGDLSKWKILKVEDMRYMFSECRNIKSVGDLNKWDVSNVEHMKHMFYNAGITNIPKWYKE